MTNFQIVVEGEVQLNRYLDRFVSEVKDLTPVWGMVVEKFHEIQGQQFDSEGHGDWVPLSPSYARWKATHYPGRSILVREGKLRTAATGGAGAIVRKSPTTLELGFGNSVPYWRYHQTGTSQMPARRVISLREEDKLAIMKAFHRSLLNVLGRLRP